MTDPVHIACMKWGTRYGPEFVNRLFLAVRRNLSRPFIFHCFTDNETGLIDGIVCHPLPPLKLPNHAMWTPWRKLSLWQSPLAGLEAGDLLVLDIDLVITGPLDEFFAFRPGEYCVIENWTKPGKGVGNTSVFRIPIGRYTELYETFVRTPETIMHAHRIEQQYISAFIPEQVFWPREWCLSFKHTLLPRFPLNWVRVPDLPRNARIIAFTGHPDPDEARDGHWPAPWYKRFYKHVRAIPWIAEHWRE